MIQIKCSHCGQHISADKNWLTYDGDMDRCPACDYYILRLPPYILVVTIVVVSLLGLIFWDAILR